MEGWRGANPVRARSVGDLLDATFRDYRNHFRFIMTAAVYILVPYLILQVVFVHQSVGQLQQVLNALLHAKSSSDLANLNLHQTPRIIWVSYALSLLDLFVVMPLLYGTLVQFVTGKELSGRVPAVQDAFAHSFRRLVPAIVTLLIAGLLYLGVLMAVGLVVGIAAGALSALGGGAAVVAGIITVVLVVVVVILAIWLLIRLAFVPAVVMVEDIGYWRAIRRSWQLSKGKFWRTLGFFVLLSLILGVVRSGINALALLLIHNGVVTAIVLGLVTLFTNPFSMLATSHLYVDLRVRTDGLDLEGWADRA